METRTYFSDEEGTTTVDRIFGHTAFPCPPTRGEVDSCEEAWGVFQANAPLHLSRAQTRIRPRLGPPERPEDTR